MLIKAEPEGRMPWPEIQMLFALAGANRQIQFTTRKLNLVILSGEPALSKAEWEEPLIFASVSEKRKVRGPSTSLGMTDKKGCRENRSQHAD
jgi:hypothetical protein